MSIMFVCGVVVEEEEKERKRIIDDSTRELPLWQRYASSF